MHIFLLFLQVIAGESRDVGADGPGWEVTEAKAEILGIFFCGFEATIPGFFALFWATKPQETKVKVKVDDQSHHHC